MRANMAKKNDKKTEYSHKIRFQWNFVYEDVTMRTQIMTKTRRKKTIPNTKKEHIISSIKKNHHIERERPFNMKRRKCCIRCVTCTTIQSKWIHVFPCALFVRCFHPVWVFCAKVLATNKSDATNNKPT